MSIIRSWIEKLDMIGPQYRFEKNDSARFKTLEGSFLSIIVIVAAIALAFQFGQDIYERQVPSVSSSREFINTSEVYFKDLPLMFSTLSSTGKNIRSDTTLDFWAEEYKFDQYLNATVTRYELVNCKEMIPKFRMHQNIVAQAVKNPFNYYCLNFIDDQKFMNEFTMPTSIFYIFNFRYCQKEERADCDHDPILQNENLVISLTYVDNFVDSKNYTHPIQPYIPLLSTTLSTSLSKLINFDFTNNEFISDNGWLIEDINKINYIQLSMKSSDVLVSKEISRNMIYQVVFSSPRIRIKEQRVYIKVQELFARIGGIANAFIIIVTAISYHYLRFKYLIDVWRNSFNMIDDDYVLSMRKDNNFIKLENVHVNKNPE